MKAITLLVPACVGVAPGFHTVRTSSFTDTEQIRVKKAVPDSLIAIACASIVAATPLWNTFNRNEAGVTRQRP